MTPINKILDFFRNENERTYVELRYRTVLRTNRRQKSLLRYGSTSISSSTSIIYLGFMTHSAP